MNDLFLYGATWLRADFHLHTKADSEFKYIGDGDFYNSTYVDALNKANIHIGIIANHNKFDYQEFKSLQNTAKKKEIFLIPGVELSVNDGANGIHTIIVFSDEWLENDKDRVSPFISSMFPGKATSEYQNENGRSDKNILQIIEELDRTGHDYFIIFAHVEDAKGLWHETGGGKLQDWREKHYQPVKERTLGFQQVRTHDTRKKVKNWFEDWYPAEVEGSDPKNIDQIGQKESCYLKIGAFTFEAIKFALIDYHNRVCLKISPKYTHSHIEQIHFEGGALNGQTIHFSPELNTLIGIRGSGKSSILETIRYILGTPLDINESDYEYKQKLVERTFGSGGKVIIDAIDRHGLAYQIQRIWKENTNVYMDGKLQPGISVRETVLKSPLFFGQKEITAANKGSEKDIIEKLIGTKCDEIRHQIAIQKSIVEEVIDKLTKVNNVDDQIEEQTNTKHDAEYRLNFYKKHNLEEKLEKRLNFDTDIRKVADGTKLVELFISDIKDLLANHEDDLRNYLGYKSKDNAEFFQNFELNFSGIIKSITSIQVELSKSEVILKTLKNEEKIFIEARKNLTDEFAAVERILAEELKTSNEQNISTDEFLLSKKKLVTAEAALAVLVKNSKQKNVFQMELNEELQKLNNLWHNEFQIVKTELDEVSTKNEALKFIVEYKEDKKSFIDYFKTIFKGSGVRDITYQNIASQYHDFAGIFNDFENAKKLFGNNPDNFIDYFMKNLKTLLTYQTPNKFTITYHDMKLADHSLGQRASALILFVLGQRDNDVIIIDQPEDDLDNQTIYDDVIKLISELKPSVQFIFATHNPNIPVLGDAEQIHACSFSDSIINVQSGGLDNFEQQRRIVKIMEGGKEAFDRRKEIYKIWKS